MVKSGSFKPGKAGSSVPRPVQGRNGPDGKGGGTPTKAHPHTGTNRKAGVDGNAGAGSSFTPGH